MPDPETASLARLSDAGLPQQVMGLAAWLLASGGKATIADACARFGVTDRCIRRWSRDLEAIGAARREKRSRESVLVLTSDQMFRVKQKTDGKPQRCRVCRVVVRHIARGGTGDLCSRHKESHGRADQAWWPEAEKLLKRRMSPLAVHARLLRQGVWAPVADYLLPDREKRMPGMITRGRRAGLLSDEWDEVHRNLLAGEDADQ